MGILDIRVSQEYWDMKNRISNNKKMKIYNTNSIFNSKKIKYNSKLVKISSVEETKNIVRVTVICKDKYLEVNSTSGYTVNGDNCEVISFKNNKDELCELCFSNVFKNKHCSDCIHVTALKWEYEILFVSTNEKSFKPKDYEYFLVKQTKYVDGKDRIKKIKI